jgi:hypothetical protein
VPWLDAKALETDREGLAFLRSVLEGARPCPSDMVYGPPSRASREAARRTKRLEPGWQCLRQSGLASAGSWPADRALAGAARRDQLGDARHGAVAMGASRASYIPRATMFGFGQGTVATGSARSGGSRHCDHRWPQVCSEGPGSSGRAAAPGQRFSRSSALVAQ